MRKKSVIKRHKKAFLLMALCILIPISFKIYCQYLREEEEQLRYKIRERMFAKVIKYEKELMETVEECEDEKIPWLIVRNPKDGRGISHKKLNDGRIKKTFRAFRLLMISKYEDGSVNFTVYSPVVNYVWDDYRYGFYYSKDDKAINVLEGGEECETEFEKKFIGYYWYRTEKITDNWWYYECRTRFFRTPLFNFWESAGNRIMPSKSKIRLCIIKLLVFICMVSILCIKFLFKNRR